MKCAAIDVGKSVRAAPAWLVIGYGNPLRRDDGAGWAVVEMLAGAAVDPRDATLLAVHQLTPELAEAVGAAHTAVFVDAAVDVPAGEVRWAPVDAAAARRLPMAHIADPTGLLALAERVFGGRADGQLVTIGAGDLGVGEGLSPPVRAAAERVAARLRRLFDDPLAE